MRLRAIHPALLVCCGLAMAGCGTLIEPGAPDQSFDVDEDIQALEEVFAQGMTIKEFYKKEIDATTEEENFPNKTKENRDQFIATRLTLMNIQYIKFIRRFAAEKAQLDSAADILVEGLGLAGALVGAASTKAILAAISTGTSASRTSINKNFFHEQTVPVLITAMNAQRKEALVPILKGQDKPLTEYSFGQALSDLNLYYHAGTFIGALQAIQKDSGVKEAAADLDIKQFRDTKFQPDTPTGVRIEAWSELSTENNDELVLWLRENKLGEVGHPAFFTASVLEAARVQAIKDLEIPPIP